MAESFEDLGIVAPLVAAADAAGWVRPAGLQRDAVPVIRRGNNVVLHASSGAGVTGAYGLGVLDRLLSDDAGEGLPRALVLVTDGETATRTAHSLATLSHTAGLTVRALAPGWPVRQADLLVASAAAAVAAIQDSSLKLDGILALVVDGADQLQATGQWTALETVLEAMPAEAQRILVTGKLDQAVDGLAERHVRRAMTIPPRPAEAPDAAPAPGPSVRFAVVSDREKTAAIVALVGSTEAREVAVVCRTGERADRLAGELRARGLSVEGDGTGDADGAVVDLDEDAGEPAGDVAGEPRDADGVEAEMQPADGVPVDPASGSAGEDTGAAREPRIRVLPGVDADRRSTQAVVVSADLPFDAGELSELHARGGFILAAPRELAHLRRMAERVGASLEPIRLGPATPMDALHAVRERLRQTARDADLAADLALIEPLLEDFSAPVLAAAALHLARAGAAPAATAAPDAPGAASPTGRSAHAASPTAPPPATSWTRLFVGAGSRDGLTPGDLVGAIAGETDLAGAEVGKIEIRESHSTVEVPTASADAVIKALNGRTLRGRSLRVDYDRKDRSQGRPPARGGPRTGSGPRGPAPGPRGPNRGGPGGGPRGGSRGGPGGGSRGGPGGGSRGGAGGGSRGGAGGGPRGGPRRRD